MRLSRKMPRSYILGGRSQYLNINGEAFSGSADREGVKPARKLEKTCRYNGGAYAEYGLVYFWGEGEGGFYATGDFAKGLTHRAQFNANFQVGENIHLNFDYIIRLEPEGNRLVQKMTAEARAVF